MISITPDTSGLHFTGPISCPRVNVATLSTEEIVEAQKQGSVNETLVLLHAS